jgi:hypothetical protein
MTIASMMHYESTEQISVSAPINSVVNKRFAASYGVIGTSVLFTDVFCFANLKIV